MNSAKSPRNPSNSTRRSFLKSATLGLGALASGLQIVPSRVFGAAAPSKRIHIGLIGCGNQSTVDLPAFLAQDDVQLMAVCDVNTAGYGYRTPKQYLGRKPVQEKINAHYAAATRSGSFKGCDAYHDFRDVLRRSEFDAVAIIVPDHWHGLMTAMAAEAGKDIYCEKPLSLTVRDGQEMVKAVRRHKRILQTGSQYRSSPACRHACELVRNGRIGRVSRVVCAVAENNFQGPGPGWQPMPVPDGFDYDMWLGPAPDAPYHKDRCFYRFRFILDYSGGQVTNFGATRWTSPSGPLERTTPNRSNTRMPAGSGRPKAASSRPRPMWRSGLATPMAPSYYARRVRRVLVRVSMAAKAGSSTVTTE